MLTAPAPAQYGIPRAFAELEPPPLKRPAQAIAWANDVVLLALHQVLHDPDLKPADRYRWIKDYAAVIGMLRDKAAEQAAIKESLRAEEKESAAVGTIDARGRGKTPVEKPPG